MQDTLLSIINNFKAQQSLYLRMAEMAQLQLTSLEQQISEPAVLPEILLARQELMQEIDKLNKQNKDWQEQLVAQLRLPMFSLSQLEKNIETDLYQALCEVLDSLRDILALISRLDEQNHALLQKNAGTARSDPPVNREKARHAYQQAVKQGQKKN